MATVTMENELHAANRSSTSAAIADMQQCIYIHRCSVWLAPLMLRHSSIMHELSLGFRRCATGCPSHVTGKQQSFDRRG